METFYRVNKNHVYLGFFLFLFAVIIALIVTFKVQPNPLDKIKTFADCKAAGYPVVTSDIRICTLPNNFFFVDPIVPEIRQRR